MPAESTRIPLGSILIFFMVAVDEVPVSVNTLYMSFSTVLYFPTVTFTQFYFVSSSPARVCGRLRV